MSEPFTAAATGAATIASAKLLPALVGFVGALITLSYMPDLSRRQWVTAVLFGTVASYFVPPIFSAWAHQSGAALWLPADGSIEGLCGLLLGMGSIHIVGGVTVLGRRFSGDPTGFVRRRGEEEEK